MKKTLSCLCLTLLLVSFAGCKKKAPVSVVETINFNKEAYTVEESSSLPLGK